jgi:hypothetical protein
LILRAKAEALRVCEVSSEISAAYRARTGWKDDKALLHWLNALRPLCALTSAAHPENPRAIGHIPAPALKPDNLKSGVHKASFCDPEVNRSYGAMAAHYGVGVLPARPYHQKDKPKSRPASASLSSICSAGCAS